MDKSIDNKLSFAEKVIDKNPNADINFLLSFDEKKEKSFIKEYILSAVFFPAGIYFFIKNPQNKRQGFICLLFTIVCAIVYYLLDKFLFQNILSGISASTMGLGSLNSLGISP